MPACSTSPTWGQSFLRLEDPERDVDANHRAIAAIAETLVCGDIAGLSPASSATRC